MQRVFWIIPTASEFDTRWTLALFVKSMKGSRADSQKLGCLDVIQVIGKGAGFGVTRVRVVHVLAPVWFREPIFADRSSYVTTSASTMITQLADCCFLNSLHHFSMVRGSTASFSFEAISFAKWAWE